MASPAPLEILYQAIASPYGLVVAVDNFIKVQAKFYTARRESGDPDLDILQFRRSPFNPEQELWIVKGKSK